MNYFAKPIAGTPHTRYYLMRGELVIATQISRPDGTEIAEPPQWRDGRERHERKSIGPRKVHVYEPKAVVETKRCPKCLQTKPARMFGIANHQAGGLQSYCKPCRAADSHRRYRITKEAARAA